jgi:hypothetical protein
MELPKDWARLQHAYEVEENWRQRGELAIRLEMERRVEAYFERKRAIEDMERISANLPPRPRLVHNGTSGHLNKQNRDNRDRAAQGLPRQRDLNQQQRQAEEKLEDIRRWR